MAQFGDAVFVKPTSFTQNHLTAARKLAHRLTGAASAVGARSLAESMRRIEESVETCDPAACDPLLKSAENQRVSSFAALFEMLSNCPAPTENAGL